MPPNGVGSEFQVGRSPDGVAFDGSYIWVTNSYSNTVWKLDPDTGKELAGYATGIFPLSIIYDGTNMWIGNGTVVTGLAVPDHGSVTKIRAADGANLGTFSLGTHVRGMVYDGTSIWACNANDNTISQVRASNVALLGTYSTGKSPRAVAYDGAKIWVANAGENTVTVIAPQGGASASAIDGAMAATVISRAVVPAKDVDWMMGILLDDE